MVDDHLAEEARCSQQHCQVPINTIAEGQHDDIRRELIKEMKTFILKSLRIVAYIVNIFDKFLVLGMVVRHVSQPNVHLVKLRVRIQTTRRRGGKPGRGFGDIQEPRNIEVKSYTF